MTNIYFVRHAQPDYKFPDPANRPLTAEGERDCGEVVRVLHDIKLDYAISSPYIRSYNTIKAAAEEHGLEIHTDYRLRERKNGKNSNNMEMFQKRWADMTYSESDGECLKDVQDRNIEVISAILDEHEGENILLGTHGTALSTIMNYYDKSFGLEGFLRIIDYLPYVVRLGFEEHKLIEKEELLIIEKVFNG